MVLRVRQSGKLTKTISADFFYLTRAGRRGVLDQSDHAQGDDNVGVVEIHRAARRVGSVRRRFRLGVVGDRVDSVPATGAGLVADEERVKFASEFLLHLRKIGGNKLERLFTDNFCLSLVELKAVFPLANLSVITPAISQCLPYLPWPP